MFPQAFITFLTLAGLSVADRVVVEQNPKLADGWKKLIRTPESSRPLRLSIALRQPDIDTLKTRAASQQYFSDQDATPHLSREEAHQLRASDPEDVADVLDWLKTSGISGRPTHDKDWIHVKTTVRAAEKLLDADFEFYAFKDKKPVLRTRQYSVPDSVFDAISFIHPISNFMPARKEPPAPSPLPQGLGKRNNPCSQVTTPSCIRSLYGLNYTTPDGESSIQFGIGGFLEQYANYEDISRWMSSLANNVSATGYNFSVDLINGAQNLQDVALSGSEAALDLEYGLALGYPTNITYYLTGGRGPKLNNSGIQIPEEESDNEPYLEFLENLLDRPDDEIPDVLSISYADDEVSVPRLYAERVCGLFGVLTARGTTILSGSGDGGSRGAGDSSCHTNDGSDKDVTMSVFPASCPWVTAVGAVTNQDDPPKGADFSGGGFSQYFPRESWQDSAVDSYLMALGNTLSGYYNSSMRAVPDISAVGTSFLVVYQGSPGSLMGTSASTPVVAAMIALINDARVRHGKPVLGWINKLLYSDEVRAVLQDITGGQSLSCTFSDGTTPGGWPAAVGYDLITGLGVPNVFGEFMDVLVKA